MKTRLVASLLLGGLRCSWTFVNPGRTIRAFVVPAGTAEDEQDLFEYFDPLLSPHAYPNGISPDQEPVVADEAPPIEIEPPPSTGKRFGFRTPSAKSTFPQETERPDVESPELFDPTISPHAYTNGTPEDVFVGDPISSEVVSVGVLLIDHGSKSSAANERLEIIAGTYQESLRQSPNQQVFVRAAHMEIATPSISDGIQELVELGVDEIVCHPYFLSPGRHVQEDIPQILAETMEELKLDIPIVTTDPVGSNMDVMISAIHKLVDESATVPINRRSS